MNQHGLLLLRAMTFTLAIATPWGTAYADKQGPWGAVVKLRDDTNTYSAGKPSGGWYVAPIHVTLQAADGKLLVTGFGRKAEANCAGNTQRQNPETYLVAPDQIDALADGATLLVQPIDEQSKDPTHHVLYCSGHTTLADGRVYFVGGTDYPNTLPQIAPEFGLNYARVYDPKVNGFTAIETPMGGGQTATPGMKWYPSNVRLPDGRILTAAGFHWSAGGQGERTNRSLEVFDPKVWDADHKANPFTVLTQHSEFPTNYHSGGRGFVNLFLLPKPVPAASGGGLERAVVFAGNQGQPYLYSYEPGLKGSQRFLARSVSPNPSSFEKAEGSSGVMLPDGKLMFANGGHDGMGSQRAYFYDPMVDKWTTLDLGISRIYSTATWLPNGTILVVNGYTSEPGSSNDISNPLGGADGLRKPQIIDPFAGTFETGDPWPEPTARGFHSFALLLKDGRILIGGGKDSNHDTGCEKNELRIDSPPYLSAGERPTITNVQEGQALAIGQQLTLHYTGTVRAVRGVALLAPASVTHSFNQGQRYVPLTAAAPPSGGSVTVALPSTFNEAPPGGYLLYVTSEAGVPSVGIHVRLGATTEMGVGDASADVGVADPGDDGPGGPGGGGDSDVPSSSDGGISSEPPDGHADPGAISANPDESGGCGCSLKSRPLASLSGALTLGLLLMSFARRRFLPRLRQ